MRFDTPVYFRTETQGEYNPKTGNYGKTVVSETEHYANVTDASDSFLSFQYGKLKEGVKVVRIQGRQGPCDHVRIGSRLYKIARRRVLARMTGYVVEEVQ